MNEEPDLSEEQMAKIRALVQEKVNTMSTKELGDWLARYKKSQGKT